MSVWTIRATIGDTTWTATRVTDADPPEAVPPALVSVRWTDELEPGDRAGAWPRWRAITTAQVVLIMEDATEAAWITNGLPVYLEFLTPGTPDPVVVAWWAGRASDPKIQPHELGVLVTVTCTEYLADLGEYTSGLTNYAAGEADDHLLEIMEDAGLPDISATGTGVTPFWDGIAARPAEAGSVLDLVTQVLTTSTNYTVIPGIPVPTVSAPRMYEVRPNLSAGVLDPSFPWKYSELLRSITTPAPLVLTEDPPGTWTATVDPTDPDTRPYVLDADSEVLFDAVWSRRLVDATNTVDVVMHDQTLVRVTTAGDAPRVTYRVETHQTEVDRAAALASFLLPDTGEAEGASWQPETLTVLLNNTPDGFFPGPIRSVFAVGPLQARHHPEGSTYWVGVVTRIDLDASAGDARATLTMESRPVDTGADSITIDQLPGTVDGLAVRIDDLAHVRA